MVTPSELLALVGRAWVRLLVYPGGLSLFAIVWFAFEFLPANTNHERNRFSSIRARLVAWASNIKALNAPIVLAAPWLAVSLLPFPGAVHLGRGIDSVVTLALLDVPLWYALWRELRIVGLQERGVSRLAAALNGYPTLLLATLLLATNSSLELGQLVRPPAALSIDTFAHWVGATGFTLALPPIIGIGPFTVAGEPRMQLGLRVRTVGFWALASLVWMAPLQDQIWQVLPPILLAVLLYICHQTTFEQPARTWARGYVVLAWLLLVVLLVTACWQLATRLR